MKILFMLLLCSGLYSQSAWVWTENKEGKTTTKECLSYVQSDTSVVFVITNSTYKSFRVIGRDRDNRPIWVDGSNKVVHYENRTWCTSGKKCYYIR